MGLMNIFLDVLVGMCQKTKLQSNFNVQQKKKQHKDWIVCTDLDPCKRS